MTQFGRPVATLAARLWAPSGAATLHEAINEVTLDTSDFAESLVQDIVGTFEVSLGSLDDPGVHSAHELIAVARRVVQSQSSSLIIELRQGTTLIGSGTFPLTPNFALYSLILSTAAAASISDYTDLRMSLGANHFETQQTLIAQAFMQIPDAITAPEGDGSYAGVALVGAATATMSAPARDGDGDYAAIEIVVSATATVDLDAREGNFTVAGPELQASSVAISSASPIVLGTAAYLGVLPIVIATASFVNPQRANVTATLPMAILVIDVFILTQGGTAVDWIVDDPMPQAWDTETDAGDIWTEDIPDGAWP